MQKPIIEIVDVSKKFGSHTVLKNVYLSVPKGSVLGLVGQSGSGKTTLIRIILGIYKPTSGKILVHGGKAGKGYAKRIGFASQEYSFYPRLTVEENLFFYGKMYGLSRKTIHERQRRLLKKFELNHAAKVKAKKLSGGMKRRLDIAIALLHQPELIILDEPTTGLDVVLKEKIWDLIESIKKMGITLIISSHDLQELQDHCSDIAFIRNGYVYDQQTLRKYRKQYGNISLSKLFKSWYIENG